VTKHWFLVTSQDLANQPLGKSTTNQVNKDKTIIFG
jgi:hypothetical protein